MEFAFQLPFPVRRRCCAGYEKVRRGFWNVKHVTRHGMALAVDQPNANVMPAPGMEMPAEMDAFLDIQLCAVFRIGGACPGNAGSLR